MIRVNTHVYTVVGTFAEKGSAFGGDQDDILIVPITRFFTDNGIEGYTVNIATQAPSPTVYNETMEKGVTAMRIVRGLRPADENDFEMYSNDSLLAAFAKIADAVRAGAFVISAIALLAAGVGIMNIMLVSVTERTKEIGVRKSIGARKDHILAQFLVEAVVISLIGGRGGHPPRRRRGRRPGALPKRLGRLSLGLGVYRHHRLHRDRRRLRVLSRHAGRLARSDRGASLRVR